MKIGYDTSFDWQFWKDVARNVWVAAVFIILLTGFAAAAILGASIGQTLASDRYPFDLGGLTGALLGVVGVYCTTVKQIKAHKNIIDDQKKQERRSKSNEEQKVAVILQNSIWHIQSNTVNEFCRIWIQAVQIQIASDENDQYKQALCRIALNNRFRMLPDWMKMCKRVENVIGNIDLVLKLPNHVASGHILVLESLRSSVENVSFFSKDYENLGPDLKINAAKGVLYSMLQVVEYASILGGALGEVIGDREYYYSGLGADRMKEMRDLLDSEQKDRSRISEIVFEQEARMGSPSRV